MVNKPKSKGTALETLMCNYFQQWWPDAYRPAPAGKNDVGDIAKLPLPVELKNCKSLDLAGWAKEAAKEAENAGAMFCPVIHKRKGVGDPARQWVTLEAWMLVELMLAYEEHNKDR